jgi:putative phage-type endonuclease
MPLLNLKQQTPEWHDYRKGKIGASLAPVIMGVSPWQTPYQLWEEILEIRPPKIQTESMKRGLDLEQIARNQFEIATGIPVYDAVYQHDEIDWMFASLDGYSPDGQTIVEIKCPGLQDQESARAGIIPEKYYPQLQHQIAVTNANKCFYVSYDGHDIAIVQAYRDQDYIDELIEAEKEFVRRVRTFDAPAMTERDVVSRKDSEWKAATDLYSYLVAYQKNLERRIEKTKNDIIELSQGKNCKGNSISLTKVARKGQIDYSQIPELEKVDIEKYRKPVSSYWKISINGVE